MILLAVSRFSYSRCCPAEYRVIKSISPERNGGWDYLTVEKASQRLFVSLSSCVEMLDLKTGNPIGQIQDTPGVHGTAVVPELNRGFISAGRADSVIVFDLSTLEVLDRVITGKNPDFILFDVFSNRVFTFNGRGNSVTAIDAKTNRVLCTMSVSGKPEAAVSNGKDKIFCNIRDKSTVVRFDAVSLNVEAEWPLEPGTEPTGLAMDLENNRLFSACSESDQVMVLDAGSGKIVAALPIGDGCDGIIWIPGSHDAVSSNGEETMTVIRQEGPDAYKVVQTLTTRKSVRTLTYDETTRRICLPYAGVKTDNRRRSVVPGSFNIVVVANSPVK